MHIHTIQLNIEKLLGGTIGMDATEFGAYMSLIIACYQSDNKISNEPKRLAIMARVSLKTWTRIEPIISPKFTKSDTSWSHEVVRKELVKYNSLSTKNKANILKRYNNDLPVVETRKYQKPTNTNNNKQIRNNNIIIPPIIPQVDWEKWVKYRSEIKKPLKPSMIEGQIKKLTEWHNDGFNISQILNESIANGWTGLFKPKEGKQNGRKTRTQDLAEQASILLDELGEEGIN